MLNLSPTSLWSISLKHNSYPIKFTFCKYITQWFLVYHQVVQPSPLSDSTTFSSLLKETLSPVSSSSPSPCPCQTLAITDLQSLGICLFWASHMNGIVYSVLICAWLLSLSIRFSRFIQVVRCTSTSFFSMA